MSGYMTAMDMSYHPVDKLSLPFTRELLRKGGKYTKGSKKGKTRRAKYRIELKMNSISSWLRALREKYNVVGIIIECQFTQTPRAKTIYQNYGKLYGVTSAIFGENLLHEVYPVTWKKYARLSQDKDASIKMYKKIVKQDPVSHDHAESGLLAIYLIATHGQNV